MNAETQTHATLLARVCDGGDSAARGEFCERYGELIRGFAVRRGLPAAECDDVLQDVLVSLTNALPGVTYDPRQGKFRDQLKSAVLHAIFKQRHRKQGDVALEGIEDALRAAANDEAVERVWDEEWRQYHLRLAMRVIAREFDEADRAAFQAYAVDGGDARETAERLNISVEQVKQAKSRILRRLSQLVEQQVADEG